MVHTSVNTAGRLGMTSPQQPIAQNSNIAPPGGPFQRSRVYGGLSASLITPTILRALTLDRARDIVELGWRFLRAGNFDGTYCAILQAGEVVDALRHEDSHYRLCREAIQVVRQDIRELRAALAEKNPSFFGKMLRSVKRWVRRQSELPF